MDGSDKTVSPPALAGLGRSFRTWRVLRRMKQAHAAELFGVAQATIEQIGEWMSGLWSAEVQAHLAAVEQNRGEAAHDPA